MKSKLFILMFSMILLIGIVSASINTNGIISFYVDVGNNYSVITFTSNGYFNTTSTINMGILVVAGGAGGGSSTSGGGGGGGGAGGIIYNNSALINGNYTINIGTGGTGVASSSGTAGKISYFGNLIFNMTAIGGGFGGKLAAGDGGSGGGSGLNTGNGGLSIQNNINGTGYGNMGGIAYLSSQGAGGGGGAGGVGVNATSNRYGGAGGVGLTFNIYNGTALYYAGGGGGGAVDTGGGAGGIGGGGAGSVGGTATSGIANTGGGGGGSASDGTGGAGGSGIVIIRYLINGTNYTINSETHNALTYETITNEIYSINITQNNTPTNAYLNYNGTNYALTVTLTNTNPARNYYTLSKTLANTASKIGANTFYYTWNVSSTQQTNSSTYNQTISPIQFGLCNATLTVPYLNISFKDEGSLNYIKAQIPNSVFTYYLGDGSINKTLTFVNTTANLNYAFCSLPANKTYYIDPYVQYKNDTSYPQRIWDDILRAYTNSTTNKTLYLLDSSEGIYVTYQVLDGIRNQLSGVQVIVNRTIEGSDYTVGNGMTDSAGSVTFWLNPDFAHSLSFSKTGYETFTLAQFPTQSAYTVTLGTSSSSGINDYIRGITYFVLPNYGEILNVSQLYNFNMTFSSTYWSLDSFGFILYGDTAVIGGNSSTNSSGGFIYNILNVSSYEHISIKIYWVINGTTTYGINNGWYTYDYEEGTGWSISNFFKDLKNYTSPTYHPETDSYTGIFGLNTNSLNLIVFIIIFLITGLTSYKFSLTSPTVVIGMIFALVFLFDVGLGMISIPAGAIKHFPTIFMLLITVASAIWEMRR